MSVKQKSMYKVFDSQCEYEEIFDTRAKAIHYFKEQVTAYPQGEWRVYRITEKPLGSGEFYDECIEAHSL